MLYKYKTTSLLCGRIPESILMHSKNRVVLIGPSDKPVHIRTKYKCEFILTGKGMYHIYNDNKVSIEGSDIHLYAHNNSLITDHSNGNNNNITLYDKSHGFINNVSGINNFIDARDKCTVEISGTSYTLCCHNFSTGIIRGDVQNVKATDDSQIKLVDRIGIYNRIIAYDNSQISGLVSFGNIEAYGFSQVNVSGTCNVEAYDSSRIVVRDACKVIIHGDATKIDASEFCVVYTYSHSMPKNNVQLHGMSKFIKYNPALMVKSINQWIKFYTLDANKEYIDPTKEVILYKVVSKQYKTQEKTKNETLWRPGMIVEMPMDKWNPYEKECGEGKFHACGNPISCLEFRKHDGGINTKFVAIKVKKEDLFLWAEFNQSRIFKRISEYPNKITFRKGQVLFECDINGNKI